MQVWVWFGQVEKNNKSNKYAIFIFVNTNFNTIYLLHLKFSYQQKNNWKIFKIYLKVWIFIFNENKFNLCKFYMERKQCHPSYPKMGIMKANEIISLVHFNVFGPLQTNTHFGCKYFHFYWWFFNIYFSTWLNTSMKCLTNSYNIKILWNDKQIIKLKVWNLIMVVNINPMNSINIV
jgi:hypothetical protein